MSDFWYGYSLNTKAFKNGLKHAPLYQLKKLLVVFTKRQREGEKVKSKIMAVRKEMERRKKNAGNNNTGGQRKIG